ncbi:hypothetical protein U8607_11535 [Methylobacterium durans]|uniref:hypothetical protein n=1 Tax=Methylobacterium durans TaxID=2202825 RepID=UPI002AFE83AB|nr:hypothetical protein [Methylobacterium durans]MEA1832714.1 hypothetical protein [Methylobacterium durans]
MLDAPQSRRPLPLVLPHVVVSLGLILGVAGFGGEARAEPPIRSAQDAACRNEARARVFATPDPGGLGPHAIGRQIYYACMKRATARPSRKARRVRRR